MARTRRDEPQAGPQDYTPIAADAESSILATLLTDPRSFDDIAPKLEPESFGVDAHQAIYRAILACDAVGKPFDQVTVADELKRAKALDKLGGVEALAQLVALAPDVVSVDAHVDIVVDKALRRRLINAGRDIAGTAMDPAVSGPEALATAESKVFELGRAKQGSSMVEMAQAVPAMLAEMTKSRTSLLVGHSSGFRDLDRMTAGFQGGQLIVIGARPAMGKSAFALQLARHIAESSNLMVPFLSYEMSTGELTMRMLSTALRYDAGKLRRGELPPGMDRDLAVAAEKMAQLPVLVDDRPPETIGGVRSEMRRLARRGPLGAIVIDYLQLMSAERRHSDSNRTQEVAEISRGLKLLASELDVPVIALSQLSRNVESRPNKRPVMSDLRESGAIEQDASLIMFLYRDAVYNAAADPSWAELIIGKHRNGPIGTVELDFQSECARFSSSDRKHAPPPPPSNGGRGGNDY
jgi:replicative DNA helicase